VSAWCRKHLPQSWAHQQLKWSEKTLVAVLKTMAQILERVRSLALEGVAVPPGFAGTSSGTVCQASAIRISYPEQLFAVEYLGVVHLPAPGTLALMRSNKAVVKVYEIS
jgi:hypothetical protein